MRKFRVFLPGLIAVLGICSCTDLYDESVGYSTSISNTIQVNAMIGNSATTKVLGAPVSSETTTENLNSFNINAWKGTSKLIDSKVATKSGGTFDLGGTYYWPEGTVKFEAFALNGEKVGTDSLPTIADDIITWSNYNVTKHNQDDPVLAYIPAAKPADANNVNLNFQHMLSRISVTACAPYFTQNYVRVLSFGFKEVDTLGTFKFKCGTDTTKTAFADTVWSKNQTVTGGKVGTLTATAWYTKGAAVDTTTSTQTAPASWADGNGPIVPQNISESTSRLSYSDGSNTVTLPWLNVIPGKNVADSLFLTYEYYNPKHDNGTGKQKGGWEVRTAKVLIGAGLVPTKNLSNEEAYNPGCQYVYNVRILGQETDDASVTQAQIVVDSIAVTEWDSESAGEIHTVDTLGSGRNLKQIIEDAPAYATVTLSKDVDLKDAGTINVSKDLTVNLNTHTVTSDTSGVIFKVAEGVKFVVKNGTLVTPDTTIVVNSVKSHMAKRGALRTVAEHTDTTGVIVVNGTLVLGDLGSNGVTITSKLKKRSCIFMKSENSSVTINNGTFSAEASGAKAVTKDAAAGTAKVEVSKGGSASFEEEGRTVVPTDVVDYKDAIQVADFATLKAAAAGTATHVTLIASITNIDTTLVISKDFVIDMNNFVIGAVSKRAIHQKKGTLTLTGSGTISVDPTLPLSKSGSSYVDAAGFKRASSVIRVGDDGTDAAGLVIGEDVTISSSFCMGVSYFGNGAIDVVVNGRVSSGMSSALSGSGKCTAGADVTINKGAVITASGNVSGEDDHTAAAIYQPQAGTLTINGGTISGATGIYVKSGAVTTSITGGTITGNGPQVTYVAQTDGYTPTGDAIVFDNCGYPSGAPTATIKGGTFTSTNAASVASYAKSGETPITGFLYGGTFNTDPSEFLADGYKATQTGSTWTVTVNND